MYSLDIQNTFVANNLECSGGGFSTNKVYLKSKMLFSYIFIKINMNRFYSTKKRDNFSSEGL
jgi:hypothetical protein